MFAVHFFNFNFTKHFDTEQEALDYAMNQSFECVVYDPQGNVVRKVNC